MNTIFLITRLLKIVILKLYSMYALLKYLYIVFNKNYLQGGKMGYDDVIPMIGDFGRYQKRIYFLLCLPAIICAFHKLGNVFLIAEPLYR